MKLKRKRRWAALLLAWALAGASLVVLSVKGEKVFAANADFTINPSGELTKYTGTDAEVVIPSSVKTIGQSVFEGHTEITSVKMPSSVRKIDVRAFWGCTGLKEINIPSNVKYIMSNVFAGCSGLEKITVEKTNETFESPEGSNAIITIQTVWGKERKVLVAGCKNTVIPSDVEQIEERAFDGCKDLKSIELPSGLKTIGSYAFRECTGLTEIAFPESLNTLWMGAFKNSGLKEVELPANVVNGVEYNPFQGCNLTSLTVAEGNRKFDSRDGCNAIIETATNELVAGCGKTVIPDSVTSIGSNAFVACKELTEFIVTPNVQKIGEYAFAECSNLTSITIPKGVGSIGSGAFQGNNESLENYTMKQVTIYGEKGSVAETYAKKKGIPFKEAGSEVVKGSLGDPDEDGKITIQDALAVLKEVARIGDVACKKEAADCDGDGEVTMNDAILILKHVAKVIKLQ